MRQIWQLSVRVPQIDSSFIDIIDGVMAQSLSKVTAVNVTFLHFLNLQYLNIQFHDSFRSCFQATKNTMGSGYYKTKSQKHQISVRAKNVSVTF